MSFNYGGWVLWFRRTFELPFVPFYGLIITYDDHNEYDVELVKNDYNETTIDYSTGRGEFDVYIRHNWKYPVREDVVHETLEQFSSWKRGDSTDVEQLIILMNKEAER